MAPFALLSGRRLAQVSELASPLVGNFFSKRSTYSNERYVHAMASASTDDAPVSQIPHLPSATAGLIGFICFLVVGILIFSSWKLYRWRRRRIERRKASTLPTFNSKSEKHFRPLILVPPIPLSPSVRWVPAKISPWIDPHLPRKPTPSVSKESILSRPASWSIEPSSEKSVYISDNSSYPSSADSSISMTRGHSPHPPVFLEAIGKVVSLHRATDSDASDASVLTENKPAFGSPPGLDVKSNIRKETGSLSIESTVTTEDVSEINSPTESTESDIATSECSSVVDSCARPGYPKLVIVKRTFPVNLPDELKVKEGERLRILREFKDGWTLCQRVSRRNPEKGAVPLCCLAELTINTNCTKSSRRRSTVLEANGKG